MKDTFTTIISIDGEAIYLPKLFLNNTSNRFFRQLKEEINWQHDQFTIFGKEIQTKRKVAFYGDNNAKYTYSNSKKMALPWTPTLLQIKQKLEKISHEKFNSCLLNYYHNGEDSMGWHKDNEPDLRSNGTIASISFGAERPFFFRHQLTKEKKEILLNNGSILLMKGEIQKYWQHCLPKRKRILAPRINLTFRNVI